MYQSILQDRKSNWFDYRLATTDLWLSSSGLAVPEMGRCSLRFQPWPAFDCAGVFLGQLAYSRLESGSVRDGTDAAHTRPAHGGGINAVSRHQRGAA